MHSPTKQQVYIHVTNVLKINKCAVVEHRSGLFYAIIEYDKNKSFKKGEVEV